MEIPLVHVFSNDKTSLPLGDPMPPPSVNADRIREVTLLGSKLLTRQLSSFRFSLWDQRPSAYSTVSSLRSNAKVPFWSVDLDLSCLMAMSPMQCHFFKYLPVVLLISFWQKKQNDNKKPSGIRFSQIFHTVILTRLNTRKLCEWAWIKEGQIEF